jgi:hemolysin activation/secretion protein
VRGFRDQSISGDVGGYVRNELTLRLPNYLPKKTQKFFGNMDLFAAYDAGWLQKDDMDGFEQGHVSGFAAGARIYGGIFFGQVSYERAIEAPDFIEKEGDLLRFNAGIRLKW